MVFWLRNSELKLPGPGEGANEAPRGPYDIEEEDSVLVAPRLAMDCCEPSRSRLVLERMVVLGLD